MNAAVRLLVLPTLALCPALLGGCTNHSEPLAEGPAGGSSDAILAEYLTGTFTSTAQAAADPENYFDIRLVSRPIWEGRDDGIWLYVEQAVAAAPQRPYRQRIYQIVREGGETVSRVYTLPGDDPLEFAGAYTTPWIFDAFSPADLEERAGCAVYLTYDASSGEFVGGTRGEGCASALGDAAYATSEMILTRDLLVTWDRGWTADGEQAWGATEGGYRFVRAFNTY